jgi:hypothetical protein
VNKTFMGEDGIDEIVESNYTINVDNNEICKV